MSNRGANRPVWLLALFALARAAEANTFIVTNLSDGASPGPAGSLRKAVSDSNATAGGPHTINFSGVSGTITLTSGELVLTRSVSINGPGSATLTVSGNDASRVFNINNGVTTAISGLTMAHGKADGGGGILNDGNLTLTSSVITASTSSSPWPGGGGILNDGELIVDQCSFSGNSSPGGEGGAYWSWSGSASMSRSTLSGNTAAYGAAIECSSDLLTVLTNVTISGNTSTGRDTGVVEAISGGSLRLEYCTVASNTPGIGNSGAINVYDGGIIAFRGTISAGNAVRQFANNAGTLTSLGHNLSTDATGGLIAAGDLPNTNPLLGPLADNNGPTLTHAILVGSPAIDAGQNATAPAMDQRGFLRPMDGNSHGTATADIGAFEGFPLTPGDFNHDGDVDAEDLPYFQACAARDKIPGPPAGCIAAQFDLADHDNDLDADLNDFAVFQRCYHGKNQLVSSTCGN